MTNRWLSFLKRIDGTNEERDFCQEVRKIRPPLQLEKNIIYNRYLM
jgi:hypothetical protein